MPEDNSNSAPASAAEPDTFIDQLPVPYIELDLRGAITRSNRLASEVFAINPDEMLGKLAWEWMPADESESHFQSFTAALESGAPPVPVRRTLLTKSGGYRTYDLFRSLKIDEDGQPSGMRCVAIDVTDELVAKDEAHREHIWLESVLGSVGDAVLVTDALGFIRYVNPAVERLTGWQPADIVGEILDKKLPILRFTSDDGSPFNHRVQIEKSCKGRAIVLDRKRYQLEVEMTTAPILDKEAGYVSGIVTLMRPATPQEKI